MNILVPYIDIHTHHLQEKEDTISIQSIFAQELPYFDKKQNKLYAAGIHPWHVACIHSYNTLQILEQQVKENNLLIIGEIGLDKLCKSDWEMQKKIFRLQLQIANQNHLPIIIHCVRAFPDIIKILREENNTSPALFHAFQGSMEIAKQLIEMGHSLSFGHRELLRPDKFTEIIHQIGYKNIFFETDDSQETISHIYAHASHILNLDINLLKEQILNNFNIFIRQNEISL